MAVLAFITSSELNLMGDAITFRNLFWIKRIPLSQVERAGVSAFWQGLPGQIIMIRMKQPPLEANGYFFRVGVLAWPSAQRWVDAVNSAVHDHTSKPG
jgi:hypothetical protein